MSWWQRTVGSSAAAEILLLAIARKCRDSRRMWQAAAALGIPWQQKKWSALAELQKTYNKAVSATTLEPVQEHAAALFGLSRCCPFGLSRGCPFGLSRLRKGT